MYHCTCLMQLATSHNDLISLATEFITLDGNFLEGDIPDTMYDLDGLRKYTQVVAKQSDYPSTPFSHILCLKYQTGALNLHENRITGSLSSNIGKLTNLEQLSLFNNELTGTIPSELGLLLSVEHILLNGTNLEGTVPLEVCGLRDSGNLLNLIVDCNKVECDCCNECIP